MRKLTPAGTSLAGAGLGLLGLGMGLGNLELLALAPFPLLLLAASLAQRPSAAPTATRALSTRAPRRGDGVDAVLSLDVPPGHDLVSVHQPLPDSFALESGSNAALRPASERTVLAFRVRPQTRGPHELGALVAETLDATGLLGPVRRELLAAEPIDVAPRFARRSNLRGRLPARGRLTSLSTDAARMGVRGTDFRELRDYAWGDPPSSIQWKATARRMSTRAMRVPVVSEYEHEGRRTVLVLLDGGPALRVGSTRETGVDYAVEAALTLTGYFLERGARVGAATYGARAGPPAYPESGTGQFARLEKALDAGAPDAQQTLVGALERMHGHLAGASPFVVVLTRVTPESQRELVAAARRLRALLRQPRRPLPLTVVDVRALDLAPAPSAAWRDARTVVELEDARAAATLASAGARLVPWRPLEEDILRVLVGRRAA